LHVKVQPPSGQEKWHVPLIPQPRVQAALAHARVHVDDVAQVHDVPDGQTLLPPQLATVASQPFTGFESQSA
jgi:hypothetical protein